MASNAALMKRFFSDLSPWEMSLIPYVYALPLMVRRPCPLSAYRPSVRVFSPTLAWVTATCSWSAIILHYRAIRMSPLSLTLPFLSFTPVFVLFTGGLILDETLTPQGIAGMLLVVLGGYVLNLDAARYGLPRPHQGRLERSPARP